MKPKVDQIIYLIHEYGICICQITDVLQISNPIKIFDVHFEILAGKYPSKHIYLPMYKTLISKTIICFNNDEYRLSVIFDEQAFLNYINTHDA